MSGSRARLPKDKPWEQKCLPEEGLLQLGGRGWWSSSSECKAWNSRAFQGLLRNVCSSEALPPHPVSLSKSRATGLRVPASYFPHSAAFVTACTFLSMLVRSHFTISPKSNTNSWAASVALPTALYSWEHLTPQGGRCLWEPTPRVPAAGDGRGQPGGGPGPQSCTQKPERGDRKVFQAPSRARVRGTDPCVLVSVFLDATNACYKDLSAAQDPPGTRNSLN